MTLLGIACLYVASFFFSLTVKWYPLPSGMVARVTQSGNSSLFTQAVVTVCHVVSEPSSIANTLIFIICISKLKEKDFVCLFVLLAF